MWFLDKEIIVCVVCMQCVPRRQERYFLYKDSQQSRTFIDILQASVTKTLSRTATFIKPCGLKETCSHKCGPAAVATSHLFHMSAAFGGKTFGLMPPWIHFLREPCEIFKINLQWQDLTDEIPLLSNSFGECDVAASPNDLSKAFFFGTAFQSQNFFTWFHSPLYTCRSCS